MLKRLGVSAMLALASLAKAQVNPDPCQQVRAEDVVTLITLNQADVTTNHDLGANRCSLEVKGSIESMGSRLDLTITKYDSHAAAVAAMKNDFPFYFDKKPALVKTADAGDHVDSILNANPLAATAEAVHANYMSRVDVDSIEAGARAHPTYEYRLQRLALQAVDATILPTTGLAPDPVTPKRQAASTDLRTDDTPGFLRWFGAGVLGISALTLLGPLIAIFVVYRVFFAPRLKRGRLLASGLPGTALMESVAGTGVTINNSPQVRYDCLITPGSGAAPYRASTKVIVSRLVSPASRVGSVVKVKIDPNDPKAFTIVW